MQGIDVNTNGKTATFRLQQPNLQTPFSAAFTNFDQADLAGAPLLAKLVDAPHVEEVRVKTGQGMCDISVTLSAAKNWTDPGSRDGKKTFLDVLKAHFYKKFIEDKNNVISPESSEHWSPEFINKLKTLVETSAQQTDISKHEGAKVRVLEYSPAERSLTLEFDGPCRSSICGSEGGHGGRTSTERALTSKICQAVPRAVSAARIKFVDAKPK